MEPKFLIRDVFLRIRLLTVKQKEPYLLFYNILGFLPYHIDIYKVAMRHKSSSKRQANGTRINNERLEFLGDAVLNVLVSDILYHKYQTKNEGFLTKTRSKIVRRETLNKIALSLGLDGILVASQPKGSTSISIYGNALEALIGAIYTDQGYRRCKTFLEEKILKRFFNLEEIAAQDTNFKSLLLEWGQQNKISVLVETVEEGTKTTSTLFISKVLVNKTIIGEGKGYTKKESQQNASCNAYNFIQSHKNDPEIFKPLDENDKSV